MSLLRHLAYIPSHSAEDVYDILARSIDEEYHDKARLLTRLFFAIATADALDQLSGSCMVIRQRGEPTMPESLSDVFQTMKAFDKLDRQKCSHIYSSALLSHPPSVSGPRTLLV
jgi:hypothetical protein